MLQRCRHTRVRTGRTLCKPPARRGPDNQPLRLLLTVVVALMLPACRSVSAPRTITLAALEQAPTATATTYEHVVVANPQPLRALCTPLGPRLGLVQIRSAQQWALLAQAAPHLRPCPDLRRGILVGLVCWAGTPVDGHWPIRIDGVQVREGAGLVRADFRGGTYLPDGVTFLETAHVPGLAVVLAVDVNGATFYPE